MDRSQVSEPHPPEGRTAPRLYPSLPHRNSDDASAELRPGRSLESTQCDGGDRLRAQILILEEQRRELISINDKWAKEYRTMALFYKEKVRDLKASPRPSRGQLEDGMVDGGEKVMTSCKKLKLKTLEDKDCNWNGDVGSELHAAQREARELRAQNTTLTRRGQRQDEEIRRLNKALEEALLTATPPEATTDTLQDVWKHQAEVYREDFLTERKDREKLKEKYVELENRFRKVRSELRVLKSQASRTEPPPPQRALECVCTHRVKHPNHPS